MNEAATNTRLMPMEAARLAMFATALEIMLVVPLRRHNVVKLRLDTNLRRQGPHTLIHEIFVPRRAVKNRNPIIWPIEAETADLIETYIQKYRPLLAKPDNPYLFPGISESARNDAQFGTDLSTKVETMIGAEFNCHLVRHYAVVRYLRQNPGAYEVAAHILGHKNPETTRRFYCGLELDAAARHANALLTGERKATKILALGAYHKPQRPRRAQGGAP
jgi:integrase